MNGPYKDLRSFVVTSKKKYEAKTLNTLVSDGDIRNLVSDLKSKSKKIIPKNLGTGTRFFRGVTQEINWELKDVKKLNTGLVDLTYCRKG